MESFAAFDCDGCGDEGSPHWELLEVNAGKTNLIVGGGSRGGVVRAWCMAM